MNPILAEERQRRSRVLSIILISVLVLIGLMIADVGYELLTLTHPYRGIPIIFLLLLFAAHTALWEANRRGYTRAAAIAFLITFYAAVLHAGMVFGAALPMGLLSYALFVTMATVTMGARAGVVAVVASIAGIWAVGLPEHAAGVVPYWRDDVVQWEDLFFYSAIIGIGAFFAWFSNRELERSLSRAYQSEAALRDERDNLEVTVEARTRAWKEAELGRSNELARLAEFGKLSAGLVHDLLNPLTAVSLSMQSIEHDTASGLPYADAKPRIDAAIRAAHRIESSIALTRKHMKPMRTRGQFDARGELRDAVGVLGHSARKHRVELALDAPAPLPISGDALALYQAFANIVLNAIESFDDVSDGRKRNILVSARIGQRGYHILVEDNGSGIGQDAKASVFDPFFTTKSSGIGLGLSVAKDAIAEFGGTISYADRAGGGTACSVFLPATDSGP